LTGIHAGDRAQHIDGTVYHAQRAHARVLANQRIDDERHHYRHKRQRHKIAPRARGQHLQRTAVAFERAHDQIARQEKQRLKCKERWFISQKASKFRRLWPARHGGRISERHYDHEQRAHTIQTSRIECEVIAFQLRPWIGFAL